MKLCTYREYAGHTGGVMIGDRVMSIDDLDDAWGQDFSADLGTLIKRGRAWDLAEMVKEPPRRITSGWRPESLRFLAPYRDPPKILGIGLNFEEHANALDEKRPDEPASFLRPATTIGDPSEPIRLPKDMGRITGEAEIGVVMGKRLKDAQSAEEARDAVLGFTTVLDLTAEDLIRKNPRFLTRAKAFDGSLVFGPWIVTRDEWEPMPTTRVRTMVDGKLHKEGLVGNMLMSPYELVAFHSRVFPWEPGDILLTGTPSAAPLASGTRIGCDVSAFPPLECTVA